ALDLIAREAVLPAFDALDAATKLRSGRWLVRYVAFARRKQANLPAPGDLRAWRDYWNDLDEKERSTLALGGAERIERSEEHDGEPNAVQLITAHSAKGLEFDTVFLPRVRPGNGMYPSSNAGDDGALACDLAARQGTSPADEERRLFYVACTRAKRRLVLLAAEKKGTSTGSRGDYFLEMTAMAEPSLRVPTVPASEWIERAAGRLHAPGDALDVEAEGSGAGAL